MTWEQWVDALKAALAEATEAQRAGSDLEGLGDELRRALGEGAPD
ncbi:MAG TPA: hypothetical protein VFM93_02790 [Candidatus Limnocylindria bacterium]|nr:hypothetical protein [Candidatus Limnocylindria bacterium]